MSRPLPTVTAGLRTPTAGIVRRYAIASVMANIGIVVTGGAVRLTGSGLGCPTWPRCTDTSLTPTAEFGIHGSIEFGNRLLTYVVGAVALLTLIAAFRARPIRRDWRQLSLALFLGIPAQALLGGVTVLTNLNPWAVMLHFLLSMVLVAAAVVLVHRTREGQAPGRPLVPRPLFRLAQGMLGVLAVVLYLGTIVTGSGPHAGDADSPRTGIDPTAITMLHADAVLLLVGLSIAVRVALAAIAAPARSQRAYTWLLAAELLQGALGYTQHFLGLPVLLVGLHLLGAGLLVVAAVHAVLTLRVRGPADDASDALPAQRVEAVAARAGEDLARTG